MRLSFIFLLLATSSARAARAASVSRDPSDPAVVEGEEAAGVGGGSREEVRSKDARTERSFARWTGIDGHKAFRLVSFLQALRL